MSPPRAQLAHEIREGGFSRRMVGWLVGVSAVSFACAILFAIFGDVIHSGSSAGADTFSRSAIGHRGLVELLNRLDVPVLVSESDTDRKLPADATLVVAEPFVFEQGARSKALVGMVGAASRALVVLPKWYGQEDPQDPSRLAAAYLVPEEEVEPILRTIRVRSRVVRLPADQSLSWSSTGLDMAAAPAPWLSGPQLIDDSEAGDLEPILWTEHGILVGVTELDGTEVWVLSDPDLIANHGLGRGDNAVLALAILQRLRGDRGAVVFDETLHGFKSEPSIWRVLFEFPLALATVQVLLAVGLLLWAATGRFGKPAAEAPPITPGKEFLIHNTAALLRFGGHAGFALRRYLVTSVHEVARALHAPPALDPTGVARWLDRLAASRGIDVRLADLEREVGEVGRARRERGRRVVDAARRIDRWKQEMTHGSRDSSRTR